MINRYPSYYFEFRCVGGDCPDTCCAGWKIAIDDRSLGRYLAYPGGFGNRIRNAIDFKNQSFVQYEHQCVLFNEKGLCDLQAEAGERMLCRTCARYPRHMEDYGSTREFSLNLSCPEAARLILTQEKLNLIRIERPEKSGDDEGVDKALLSELLKARKVLLQIVQNESTDIRVRMMMLLGLSHRLQQQLNAGRFAKMDPIYGRYLAQDAGKRYSRYMAEKTGGEDVDRLNIMKEMFHFLYTFETVSPKWPDRLVACGRALYGEGRLQYERMSRWHMEAKMQEQLLAYFLYIYFAGAVYDGRPYVKVKMAVVSVMLIEEMLRARAWEHGNVSLEACIDTAHRFARELEHSDTNLERMETMLMKGGCFHIRILMQLLLQ